ncbi:TolC family protein [Flavihumibacter sp.]|uniref:TolC family protein n=1 Tax=Flavihumibacter sp. TaxID=1913981 RepID=UPI002FC5C0B5|nr:TolC family protein [Flavihumibacter sediminis]
MKKNNLIKIWLPLLLLSANNLAAQTKNLALDEAIQLARKGNRQLQIQALNNRVTDEAVKEARSYLLPSVTANGSYSVYTERPVIYLRNETGSPKLDDVKYGGRYAFDGSITATYPLLKPVQQSNIRLAKINTLISREETKSTEEQLALQVSQLYLTVLLHQQQVQVLKQSLSRNELALKDSRSLFLQGKNLKTDTLSNYISIKNLEANISALENNIHVISTELKQLLAIDTEINIVYTDSLNVNDSRPTIDEGNTGLDLALNNRNDLKMQSLLVEQGKEKIDQERANFKPQLSAIAQYQLQSQADNLRIWNNGLPRTSFAGVKLSIPLYAGNRLKYRTTQAELSVKQNELALQEMKSSIHTELISLRANLDEAKRQWQIQEENVKAATVNYTMMNDRYRYGLGSRLELTDAELALTKARLGNLQAVYAIRLAELQLMKAMGLLIN